MAGFQDQYTSLPGHLAQFRDGNLNIKEDPTPPATESIVILGTATDGPTMQPIRVTPKTFGIFGKGLKPNGLPNGATLVPKFEELWAAGNRDIRIMRVTGKPAKANLVATPITTQNDVSQVDELGASKGNAEAIFELKNGGVTSFVLTADGVVIDPTLYVLDAGTMADDLNPAAEVKASFTLAADAVDMEANLAVEYTYEYLDAAGAIQTSTYSGSMDSTDQLMVAHGVDQVFALTQVPKANVTVKKKISGTVVDPANVVVDATTKTVTVKPTANIDKGEVLVAEYVYVVIEQLAQPTIELVSVYAGSLYNDMASEVTKDADGVVTVTITKPEVKKALMSEPPLTFKSSDYPLLKLMVDAINSHFDNNVVKARVVDKNGIEKPEFFEIEVATLEVKPKTKFTGGDDELNISKEEMYKRLGGVKDSQGYVVEQGAYQLLENYKVDTVIPLGVYADDVLPNPNDNFAYQLALACAVMSHYNNVTTGIITTSSPKDITLKGVQDHVNKLLQLPNLYYMKDRFGEEIKDGEGNKIDLGQFIQTVAGPDLLVNTNSMGVIATEGSASYGAFVSTLPVQSSPMNKILPSNVVGLRYEFSTNQLDKLTKARFVTFKYKNNGQSVAVVDAMMAAHVGSDYQRLTTTRIVKQAVNEIREVSDPFIGEPNDTANRNALTAAIAKRLDQMKIAKALLGYDFQIIATPQMELMGEAQIELSLQAPNELRRITTIVSLTV